MVECNQRKNHTLGMCFQSARLCAVCSILYKTLMQYSHSGITSSHVMSIQFHPINNTPVVSRVTSLPLISQLAGLASKPEKKDWLVRLVLHMAMAQSLVLSRPVLGYDLLFIALMWHKQYYKTGPDPAILKMGVCWNYIVHHKINRNIEWMLFGMQCAKLGIYSNSEFHTRILGRVGSQLLVTQCVEYTSD